MRLLAKSGLIKRYIINVHPPLPVNRPLFRWRPGMAAPDADRISTEARARWSQPARPVEVLVASPHAANMLGSNARNLPPAERRDHALRLAAVYLHYRTTLPNLAGLWVGEHALPKPQRGTKVLNAVVHDENGRTLRGVQTAGRWNRDQVESFHEHCVDCGLPYELW